MDFLRIRKEARERAAEGAAGAEGEPSRDAAAPAPPEAPPPETAPGARAPLADAAALEGALAERLRDGGASPAAPGPRPTFTTWRPGSGAPPAVPAPPPRPAAAPDLADFALVRPGGAAPIPVPVPVSAAPRGAEAADPFAGFFFDPEEPPPPGELGATAPAPPAPAAEASAREEYLTFLLGAEEYAVAIERVREVLKCPPVTEVPRAPTHVLGVVTVRGEVVAVFEPRRRLGLPSAPPADGAGRIVIVDAGDGPCGLLVDAVASVVRLPPGSIEPCPQGIGGASQEYLAGIGREGDRLFTVLDLGALLRRPSAAAWRGEGRAHGA
jgi:purine-binding chemotaxis protein CheW